MSIRLSDGEKERLERLQERLARYWKRERIERADVLRAALALLEDELRGAE